MKLLASMSYDRCFLVSSVEGTSRIINLSKADFCMIIVDERVYFFENLCDLPFCQARPAQQNFKRASKNR